MNSESIELATTLVHCASLFGFMTNSIAVITIRKCVDLHTSYTQSSQIRKRRDYCSFGILCACLAANNSCLVVLNSLWYSLPDTGIFTIGSILSRTFGMVGCILWIGGIRIHLLISINRLIAIVYPLKRKNVVNAKNTAVGVIFVLLATILQCCPLILMEDIWFCFDRSSMQWVFGQTDYGKFYEKYLINISNTIEIYSLLIIDVITILHLRFSKGVMKQTNAANTRAVEIRLFKQAFSQSIPLLVTLTFFAFVTPRLSDNFAKFLTTTFVWHVAHGVDGLIIDLFQTRKEIFIKKKKTTNSIAVSSSFGPTTTV